MEPASGYIVAKLVLQKYESGKRTRLPTPEESRLADKIYSE